ncbi:MAG: urease accessory protein UreD [Leptolyngbyaceae cyanobacterium]
MEVKTVDREKANISNVDRAWHGKATLTYSLHHNRTTPQAQTQSPLKVQRPFYPEGPAVCHSVLLHTAGGMVGGDRLSYDIRLAAGTHALITTAAAAKIYGEHRQPAQINGTVKVETGACLEWLPQEAIVFEGARYQQNWRVELAPDATWLGWDILRLGRTARGEQFRRGEVRSRFEVWQGDRLVWIDPQRLVGSDVLWRSPHALKTCPVIATLAWVGTVPDASLVALAREAWETIPDPMGEIGVTRLQSGLLCRYRGQSTTEVRRWFTAVWSHLRPHYAGRTSVIPRVWQR